MEIGHGQRKPPATNPCFGSGGGGSGGDAPSRTFENVMLPWQASLAGLPQRVPATLFPLSVSLPRLQRRDLRGAGPGRAYSGSPDRPLATRACIIRCLTWAGIHAEFHAAARQPRWDVTSAMRRGRMIYEPYFRYITRCTSCFSSHLGSSPLIPLFKPIHQTQSFHFFPRVDLIFDTRVDLVQSFTF